MAELKCYEENFIQVNLLPRTLRLIFAFWLQEVPCSDAGVLLLLLHQAVYRVMVEIVNENDNSPEFADDGVLSLDLSEVTAPV